MSNEQGTPESRESRTGYGQTAYKRQLAYRYLGLKPEDVATVTFFRANLRRIARCINLGHSGTPLRPFEYLASTADPEARKVLKAYQSVPASYRKLLPPEAFCQVAGVSPWHILEIITGIAVRFGAQASSVLVAAMLPPVVQKIIGRALETGGTKERAMVLQATGLLPPRMDWP